MTLPTYSSSVFRRRELLRDLYGPAFLGQLMVRITEFLIASGAPVAAEFGITAPVRTFSILVLLRTEAASSSELASALGVTHVAIVKNVRALLVLGLVEKSDDPGDARRKPISLTDSGTIEAQKVHMFMELSRSVFEELFEDVGHDVFSALHDIEDAFKREGLGERIRSKIKSRGTGS
ncbi:winged helix-turn-helix transcriptional regulator [Hyphobacterium sp. CCMP332]|uniref:MarR family winged helix-turn-helix transcriptional regulator n=1 Tax=Hyphobacterium sp. CCMP332 TaxID=2749086 RepID=UPI00164F66AE|nr:MarR family winged helix-turn-helix transcriptional regulator [Hyphobacterium sp. CCMP332]QNL19953.1 winged helix-turn-helix transcriptional regulator [Hyphobacterium sp. CCMP332]